MLSRYGSAATLFARNLTAVFESATDAAVPSVVLSAPSVIGACDNLLVDGRLSTGSGGRSFSRVEWNVTLPHTVVPNTTLGLNLTSLVNEASTAGLLFLKIPSALAPFGSAIYFLRLSNWFGNNEDAAILVTKVSIILFLKNI